jgi:biopolymer transport protein ExbD
MSFVPEDELKNRSGMNMAPMIDFLFLMLMFFATLAISRITTKDTEIDLVEVKPENKTAVVEGSDEYKIITISINSRGEYQWVTEIRDYQMEDPQEIAQELNNQYEKGLLPEDKLKTQVFLKIDKAAQWEPILKVIFAVRDAGFEVRPVYEPEDVSLSAVR